MSVTVKIHDNSTLTKKALMTSIDSFDSHGEMIGNGYRNVIKIVTIGGERYNIKEFKVPNMVNKIVYRFFRKSKAERSFLYATRLLNAGILTPAPEAFVEYKSAFTFGSSYYISKQLKYDFTIRKLIDEPECDDYDTILRQFTQFTYRLHESGIHFLDHSPGNTLIIKNGDNYKFYLVDLNRMAFKTLSYDERLANFARLSPKDYMLDIISDEYAKLIGKPQEDVRERMYFFSQKFSSSFKKKEAFKRKYYFWRKKKL
ncbi:lipopolysaccharide kinase InaA family protein [Winogradskyella sediminis]|uniref:lipopolysaccharide kinase InaA family protein n=1 Tax=Winogradskyella sediminis TaxID=1382466 RepID=UPI000E37CC09|nr:lipopolysaccharide kinase InaA family protein [Winogradskyella sediminis]REG87229.1 lipopolysaccharide kinase (Kdo/WaaP) family protein [Winogradskyella sediminis]